MLVITYLPCSLAFSFISRKPILLKKGDNLQGNHDLEKYRIKKQEVEVCPKTTVFKSLLIQRSAQQKVRGMKCLPAGTYYFWQCTLNHLLEFVTNSIHKNG